MALNFFEPALSGLDNDPDWLDDWSAFVHILHTQFGPIDPTADAEDSIDNLKMWDNQHILKYNIDFNRLAIQTGWSNKANTLAPHCPYDLKINLEEGASLPINPMYSLSQSELTTLWEFIDKPLWIVLSIPPIPLTELWSSLFGRRTDLSDSVSISGVLTKSLKKTGTLFCSFLICSPPQVRPIFIWP